MFDVGTISLVLLIGMFILLAIGMPLGFASAFLAVVTLVMKFGPDFLFSDFVCCSGISSCHDRCYTGTASTA